MEPCDGPHLQSESSLPEQDEAEYGRRHVRPSLLLLTNRHNSDTQEDIVLADYLDRWFDITVCHPLDCKRFEDRVDGILIRNVWPTSVHQRSFDSMLDRFTRKRLKVYNDLSGQGDRHGKWHLLLLSRARFPVIPSVESVRTLSRLPDCPAYFLKPFYGSDGSGCATVTKQSLMHEPPRGFVIQPKLAFLYEVSFFFIDGKYQGALSTPKKEKDFKMSPYRAKNQDLVFAMRFVRWNRLRFGVQRIDAVRLHGGELLLTEIEDFCPFLHLAEMHDHMRVRFLQRLARSIRYNLFNISP